MNNDITITKCRVCNSAIDSKEEKFVRVQRGYFDFENEDNGNVKYEIHICTNCFLGDKDLCKFFNKIGDRIR